MKIPRSVRSVAIGDYSSSTEGYVVIGDHVRWNCPEDCLVFQCKDVTIMIGKRLFGRKVPILDLVNKRLGGVVKKERTG
jgi:hypothetical protein